MKVVYVSKNRAIKLLVVFLLVMLSVAYTQRFSYPGVSVFLQTTKQLPIYSVNTDKKKIAISFDAAWGAEYTDEILDILKQKNVKATFFLVGFWVDHYPDKVELIAQQGHEIGNHSTNHPHMSKCSKDEIMSEIKTTQDKIEKLAGDRSVKLFRPPFGDYNDLLILTLREMGYYPIQWDVIKRVTTKARNGSIVLFHNNAKYTTQALPVIIDTLIQEGYEFVPISELIYKDNYTIDHTGRQKKTE